MNDYNQNTRKQELPVFPNILPSEIVESKFHILEVGDIKTKEDIDELIRLLFTEPEHSFYYFSEKDKGNADSLLIKAKERGDVLMNKSEFFYYKHPTHERDFLKIEVRDGNYQWSWQKEVVEKGPMFVRRELKLSQRKRTELETLQKIVMEENLRKQQKIQTNNNSESKANDSSQVPENPLQAIFHVIWPPNTIWKKVVLVIVILFIVCFAVWATLPDETKKDIIHVLWGTIEQDKVQPLITPKR